jgi:uncharacterized Ntn-hydrolase superfamily protein
MARTRGGGKWVLRLGLWANGRADTLRCMWRSILVLVTMVILGKAENGEPEVHTFSIVARDPQTGDLGVAVQSRYFGVGSVVPWAKAGVGAVATQSYAKLTYGPDGLRHMEDGAAAAEAIERVTKEDAKREIRQVAMVDAKGRVAAFTGKECIAWAGHKQGEGYSVQGNLLTGAEVIDAMAKAYEEARANPASEFADWLVAALHAGQTAGGDKRGQQSAALLVVRERGGPHGETDRFIDLRVEDHARPIAELARLLELHKKFHPRGHRGK